MVIETLDAGAALAREGEMLGAVAGDAAQRHLWLWQSPQCLVAPRKLGLLPGFEGVARDLAAQGWPVHLRGSGGDVTPQGPGIVNVTHVYTSPPTKRFDLDGEYGRLCAPIETALGQGATRGWQPGAFCDGAHNVQWNGLKFAGTAMRFRPSRAAPGCYAVMAHALMLFEPPSAQAITMLNRFLEGLDQGRVIERAAHTGLPSGVTARAFVARLVAAFET